MPKQTTSSTTSSPDIGTQTTPSTSPEIAS